MKEYKEALKVLKEKLEWSTQWVEDYDQMERLKPLSEEFKNERESHKQNITKCNNAIKALEELI